MNEFLNKANQQASLIITTGCGVGFIPFCPGTFGSLIGLLLAFHIYLNPNFISNLSYWIFGLGLISLLMIKSVLRNPVKSSKKNFDPSYIIIDEVIGQLITVSIVSYKMELTLFHFGMCFLAFRVFDIFKPWPIAQIEQKLGQRDSTQAFGIIADDIVAACLAGIVLQIAFRFI